MRLRIVSGPDAGRDIDVTKELTLGRERGVDVVVRDERASRRHATVAPAEAELVVTDLGSANGTMHGGRRVDQARLGPGERFTIGETEFEVAEREQPGRTGSQPSEAAKRAAAAALADAARAARESQPPQKRDPPPPTYSTVGRLIDERTRSSKRLAVLAAIAAALAVILVVVLLAAGS